MNIQLIEQKALDLAKKLGLEVEHVLAALLGHLENICVNADTNSTTAAKVLHDAAPVLAKHACCQTAQLDAVVEVAAPSEGDVTPEVVQEGE